MSKTLPVWEIPGSIAEKFWKNGKADFPVYDVHGHMGQHNAIYMKRAEPAEMAQHLQRAGVKRLIFSHHASLWGNRRNELDYQVCCQYPDCFRMYVSINPHYPEHIREDLAMFHSWQPYAKGLKILADYHEVKVTDEKYAYALEFADKHSLPVLFHTWGSSVYNGGAQMMELIKKYRNITFLLGHSLYGRWNDAVACVKEGNGKVFLELTAIPGDHGLIEMLCSRVGSEMLLFGTDQPWFDEHQAIGGVVAADISEEDKLNILYRNAERVFGKDF